MRAPKSSLPVTPKQIALLHVAKKQLGLDEDTYRAILVKVTGYDSAADLHQPGFLAAVKYFTAMGFRSTWTKRSYGYRPTMATPAQVELIRSLWAKFLGRDDENDAELSKWLDRFHKVSSLRFVDSKKAAKVISALRNMNSRQQDQN
ncbi:regulatory protein GemA [Agrobacterium larrymoorei]|uniref:regulatory protein GemA n=1 Tax=Agrobacterium larrymoorei TaxID=160699 RepID=UPI0015748D3F|nr:regulatory protein GemA [Agrobacterium larrymoorei]NTJ42574.1 regulatory protein GemA [Agrobacterium larrymoorei]